LTLAIRDWKLDNLSQTVAAVPAVRWRFAQRLAELWVGMTGAERAGVLRAYVKLREGFWDGLLLNADELAFLARTGGRTALSDDAFCVRASVEVDPKSLTALVRARFGSSLGPPARTSKQRTTYVAPLYDPDRNSSLEVHTIVEVGLAGAGGSVVPLRCWQEVTDGVYLAPIGVMSILDALGMGPTVWESVGRDEAEAAVELAARSSEEFLAAMPRIIAAAFQRKEP
jgi:hypothetical protein